MMSTLVGKKAPEFELQGVHHSRFTSYRVPSANGSWTLLLFYPLDFTFVCPTEIIAFSEAAEKFKDARCQIYGLSVDSHFTHLAWTETPRNKGGVGDLAFPLLADMNKEVARQYGVLTPEGVALRGLFLIDEEGIIQQATINNLAVGRSVEETLRLLQAFQHVKKTGEVCPANWHPGADTMKPTLEGLKKYASQH